MSPPDHPATAPHPAPPADDLGFDLPPPAVMTRTRGVALGVGVLVVLGAAFASAYLPRRSARAALEEGVRAGEGAAPRVAVVAPQPVSSDRALVLPGSVQPLEETVVYP
ncbi:MAG TPA: efflux RND transporter periplasmic adaptor subunit, partial [Sorangium sp.]|nr:efflux RND transporter periplasmic adaptor subunit [Sorangium sp.]